MGQPDPCVYRKGLKQARFPSMMQDVVARFFLCRRFAFKPFMIMVAGDQKEALVQVEVLEQVKDLFVGLLNTPRSSVFPQIVSISQFDVHKPVLVVPMERMDVKMFVGSEVIRPPPIPAVAVANQDKFCLWRDWDLLR
jgi:hypothetical protein